MMFYCLLSHDDGMTLILSGIMYLVTGGPHVNTYCADHWQWPHWGLHRYTGLPRGQLTAITAVDFRQSQHSSVLTKIVYILFTRIYLYFWLKRTMFIVYEDFLWSLKHNTLWKSSCLKCYYKTIMKWMSEKTLVSFLIPRKQRCH